MDEQLKRRLVGASVLVALAIIFLPMLLSHKPVARHSGQMTSIPVEPARKFDPSLLQDTPPEAETVALGAVKPVSPPVVEPALPKKHPKPAAETKPVVKVEKKPLKKVASSPVAPKASASPSAWVVQVASFSSRASAEKLVKKLRKAGFDTMNPTAVTVGGKKYYRIQVGPELEKLRAKRLLPRINKISGSKGQVVRYP